MFYRGVTPVKEVTRLHTNRIKQARAPAPPVKGRHAFTGSDKLVSGKEQAALEAEISEALEAEISEALEAEISEPKGRLRPAPEGRVSVRLSHTRRFTESCNCP